MTMKIDVAKLITEVSKHPEIYNPDHKHFSNEEIRNNIFNTVIKKNMNGINGETLKHKWDQILNMYANFIRKLSNDDSSERVLEQFMNWPWTKPMRIFKPYVRKQFQIPEFQSASQLTPGTSIPHISITALQSMQTISIINVQSSDNETSVSQFLPFPTYERPSNANATPATARPAADTQLTHPIPEPTLEIPLSPRDINGFGDSDSILPHPYLPQYWETPIIAPEDQYREYQVGLSIAAAIKRKMGRLLNDEVNNDEVNNDEVNNEEEDDDEDDDDDNNSSDDDDNSADDETTTDGEGVSTEDFRPSSAKKRRVESSEGSEKGDESCTDADGDTSCTEDDEDDGRSDVLPDLPQPTPEVKRGPSDFSAQEHIFLAWAKTMSTFTAKRQATIEMQINTIMSEAEFEDLDDEFFAANRQPHRPIYTSRY